MDSIDKKQLRFKCENLIESLDLNSFDKPSKIAQLISDKAKSFYIDNAKTFGFIGGDLNQERTIKNQLNKSELSYKTIATIAVALFGLYESTQKIDQKINILFSKIELPEESANNKIALKESKEFIEKIINQCIKIKRYELNVVTTNQPKIEIKTIPQSKSDIIGNSFSKLKWHIALHEIEMEIQKKSQLVQENTIKPIQSNEKIEKEKQLNHLNALDSIQYDNSINNNQLLISSFLNIKEGSFFQKYRTLISYFFSSFSVPILFIFLIYFANQNNVVALGLLLQLLWIISAIVTIFGIYYTVKYAKKAKVIVGRLVVYFIGVLISVLMFLYSFAGANYIANVLGDFSNELPNQNSTFVYDPARLGNGNTSISFNYDVPNQSDELDVGGMVDKDTLTFYVFIDYQNAANEMLKNVKTSIKFPKNGYSSKISIFGMLFVSNQENSHIDETYITNLPNSWKLNLIEVLCTNTHSQEECPGYAYNIPLKLKEVVSSYGASLPNLDTYGVSQKNGITGACSQGHVVAQFQLINTSEHH